MGQRRDPRWAMRLFLRVDEQGCAVVRPTAVRVLVIGGLFFLGGILLLFAGAVMERPPGGRAPLASLQGVYASTRTQAAAASRDVRAEAEAIRLAGMTSTVTGGDVCEGTLHDGYDCIAVAEVIAVGDGGTDLWGRERTSLDILKATLGSDHWIDAPGPGDEVWDPLGDALQDSAYDPFPADVEFSPGGHRIGVDLVDHGSHPGVADPLAHATALPPGSYLIAVRFEETYASGSCGCGSETWPPSAALPVRG